MPEPDEDALLALLEECLERMEAEGASALNAFCEAHPAHAARLRERIATLGAAGLLDETLRGPGAEDRFPERLGEFRLLQRLGGGGMGVVYLAEQERLQRQVALKLIRPEHLYFPGARERFRREVEAVARLQHPGIVPIYTVGEDAGIPYFAMERVPGVSLAQVVEALAGRDPATLGGKDLRALAQGGDGRDSSSGESAARLFGGGWVAACLRIARAVAEALAHAHERGVLHRDIKPSNVMLTPDGRVLLLDFGLALAEGNQRITRSGSQLGSLAYMSPEQLRGEPLDARSDVYSLGVTLYELLALRAPYAEETGEATQRLILDGRPRPPRELNPSVSRDAETACLAAMDRDAARRYATPLAFAEDLGRVLDLRPIEARRPGPLLRARRWTQRHPAATVALLLGGLLLVGGPIGYGVLQSRNAAREHGFNQDLQAANERERGLNADLRSSNERLDDALGRAEADFERARRAVDVMLTQVGDKDLQDVPQMEEVRRKLLEEALRLYEDFLGEREGDAAVRLKVVEARGRVADILLQLGRYAEGRSAHEQAVQLWEQAAAEAPDELEVIAARADLGNIGLPILILQGDSAAAEAEGLATIAAADAWLERAPESREALAAAAHVRQSLTVMYANAGRTKEAREQCEAGLALWSHTLRLFPDDLDALSGLSSSQNDLGVFLEDEKKPAEAEAAYRDSIATSQRRLALSPGNPRDVSHIASMRMQLASLLGKTRPQDAESESRLAVLELETLAERFPDTIDYLHDLGIATSNLALMLLGQQRQDEAEPLLRRAVVVYDRALQLSPDAPEVLAFRSSAFVNVARLHRDREQPIPARAALLVAVDCSRRAFELQPDRPLWRADLKNAIWSLAATEIEGGLPELAMPHAEELHELYPDGKHWRYVAGLFAQCCEQVLKDPGLDEPARAAAFARYRDCSLERLQEAFARGWKDPRNLRTAFDFAALRADPDFVALVASVDPKK